MTGRWVLAIASVLSLVASVGWGSSVDECESVEGCTTTPWEYVDEGRDEGRALLQTASATARLLARKLESQSKTLQEAARNAQEAQVQVQQLARGLLGVLENNQQASHSLLDVVQKTKQSQSDQAVQDQQVVEALHGAVREVQQSEQLMEQEVQNTGQVTQQLQSAVAQSHQTEKATQQLTSSADKTTGAMNLALQQLQSIFGAGLQQDPRLRDTLAAVQDALNAQGDAAKATTQQSAALINLLQDAANRESVSMATKQEAVLPLLKNGLERLQLVETSQGNSQAATAGVLQMLESIARDWAAKEASGERTATTASAAVTSLQSLFQKIQTVQEAADQSAREFTALQENEVSILQRLEVAEQERDQYAQQQHQLAEKLARLDDLQGAVVKSKQHEQQMSLKLDAAEEARDALAAQVSDMRHLLQGARQETQATEAWQTAQETKDAKLATLLQSAMEVSQARKAGIEEHPDELQFPKTSVEKNAREKNEADAMWNLPGIKDAKTDHSWTHLLGIKDANEDADDPATDHSWTTERTFPKMALEEILGPEWSPRYRPRFTSWPNSRVRTEH